MKTLRNHMIKFHCQLGLIGMLAVVGLIAVCGEPDEWNAKRALETADELIKQLKQQDNERD